MGRVIFFSMLGFVVLQAQDWLQTASLRDSGSAQRDSVGLIHRRDAQGREVIYADAVLVKLTPGTRPDTLLPITGAVGYERIAPDLYRLSINQSTDPLDVARKLETRADVRFAHPDFHTPKQRR